MKYVYILAGIRNLINELAVSRRNTDKNKIMFFSEKIDELRKAVNAEKKNPVSSDIFALFFKSAENLTLHFEKNFFDDDDYLILLIKKNACALMKLEFEILNLPVAFINGIGPKTSELLKKKKIESIGELIFYFPEKFIYYTPSFINSTEINNDYIISGKITEIKKKYIPQKKLSYLDIKICDGSGIIICRFFGKPYFFSNLKLDSDITVKGKMEYYNFKTMINPSYSLIKTDILQTESEIEPFYRISSEIKQGSFRKSINAALSEYINIVTDFLPQNLKKKNNFICLRECIRKIHNPEKI